MKKYVLIVLFLTGCHHSDLRPVNDSDLDFAMGDDVVVTRGVFRDCTGYVAGASSLVTNSNPKVLYYLKGVKCKSKDVGALHNVTSIELKKK